MKSYVRRLALVLSLAVSAFTLSACGDLGPDEGGDGGPDTGAAVEAGVYYDGYNPPLPESGLDDASDEGGYPAAGGYLENGGYPTAGDFSYGDDDSGTFYVDAS